MRWRNTRQRYGWVSIWLHWLVALAVIGLFLLGLWMTGLSYVHPWYYRATDVHQSLGLLLLGVVAARLIWRLLNPRPGFEPGIAAWERGAALSAHWLMYLLMFVVVLSGYFIVAADGEPIGVFGWFEIPTLIVGVERQADLAGWLHYWLAWGLIGLAGLHTLAALKHHVIDRDRTLVGILRPRD